MRFLGFFQKSTPSTDIARAPKPSLQSDHLLKLLRFDSVETKHSSQVLNTLKRVVIIVVTWLMQNQLGETGGSWGQLGFQPGETHGGIGAPQGQRQNWFE